MISDFEYLSLFTFKEVSSKSETPFLVSGLLSIVLNFVNLFPHILSYPLIQNQFLSSVLQDFSDGVVLF